MGEYCRHSASLGLDDFVAAPANHRRVVAFSRRRCSNYWSGNDVRSYSAKFLQGAQKLDESRGSMGCLEPSTRSGTERQSVRDHSKERLISRNEGSKDMDLPDNTLCHLYLRRCHQFLPSGRFNARVRPNCHPRSNSASLRPVLCHDASRWLPL